MCETVLTEDLINQYLSDDSLLNVFDFIPVLQLFKLRLVCKRFQRLADYKLKTRNSIAIVIASKDDNKDQTEDNEVYESRLDCCNGRHMFTSNDCIDKCCRIVRDGSRTLYVLSEQLLNQLFRFCPNIRALSLEYTIFDRNVWQYFRDHCPQGIQHLDLSNSQGLIDEVIRLVAISCGQSLQHIYLNDSDISESTLNVLLDNCPKLEVLDVSKNVRISGQCFGQLATTIKHLAINDCWNIGFDGIVSLTSGSAKSLKSLEINGEFVDKNILEQICDHLHGLTRLEIDCSNVEDRRVLRKLSNLKRLEQLVLFLPSIHFDLIFIDIIKNNPKLIELSANGAHITDHSIKYLPQFCPHLESLSISSEDVVINKKITDESSEPLSRLKSLKNLSLDYTRIGDKLIQIIANCPQLSTLSIDGSKRVTNRLIDSMVEMAKQRPTQALTVYCRESKLTEPDFQSPGNLHLVLD